MTVSTTSSYLLKYDVRTMMLFYYHRGHDYAPCEHDSGSSCFHFLTFDDFFFFFHAWLNAREALPPLVATRAKAAPRCRTWVASEFWGKRRHSDHASPGHVLMMASPVLDSDRLWVGHGIVGHGLTCVSRASSSLRYVIPEPPKPQISLRSPMLLLTQTWNVIVSR